MRRGARCGGAWGSIAWVTMAGDRNVSLERELDNARRAIRALTSNNEELRRELSRGAVDDGEKQVKLPTEIWTMIAAKLNDNDVLAFALTSRQLREAQQQAGRELKTRPCWYDDAKDQDSAEYFSEDWCRWWSRRLNLSETRPRCVRGVIRVSSERGYLDVLKKYWNDLPEKMVHKLLDEATMAGAARGGHLDVMRWLRAKGCPLDSEVCEVAVTSGDAEILDWALSQDCTCTLFDASEYVSLERVDYERWERVNYEQWEKLDYKPSSDYELRDDLCDDLCDDRKHTKAVVSVSEVAWAS